MPNRHPRHLLGRSWASTCLLVMSCMFVYAWPTAMAPAAGQSAGRIITSPPRIVASVAAGQSTSSTLIISNRLGIDAKFKLELHDLAPARDPRDYADVAAIDSQDNGAGAWIKLSRTSLVIRNGQKIEIPLRIQVPLDTTAGGHYGAIAVRVFTPSPTPGGVVVELRLVTDVLVNVPGAVRYAASISRIQAPARAFEHTSIAFTVRDTGTIQTRPVATVELRGPLGSVARRTVNVPEMLPGGRRIVRVQLPVPYPMGHFTPRVTVRLESDVKISRNGRKILAGTGVGLGILGGLLATVLLAVIVGRIVAGRRLIREYLDDELDDYEEEHESS